ncbi:hypothetical protein SDC9_170095 [bioreactor metagenome]|uniref:Uncharacterized protein n=1 Tax=bioreactor metagenome TaxID=1076179 RepID=A0A645G9Q8_9ZZZZ
MPAQRRNTVGDLEQFVLGGEIHQTLDEVEAHAAYAGCMQVLQFLIGDRAAHGGNATGLAVGRLAGIDHRAVVGTVAGGLYDHIAGKAEMITQRKQLGLAGIARGVLALGRIGKFGAGTEYMAVGVHRTHRQLEAGLAGTGVPVKPAGGFLEFHQGILFGVGSAPLWPRWIAGTGASR